MITGLKKSDYGQPIITETEQLLYRGKETMVNCNAVRKKNIVCPINIEAFLTDEQLKGNGYEQDFILAVPKQSTLQPEGFKGRVAIDQYGFPMDLTMKVDSGEILNTPKVESYAKTVTAPSFNKLPTINKDIRNILKNPTQVSVALAPSVQSSTVCKKVLSERAHKSHTKRRVVTVEQYKTTTPTVSLSEKHMRERLDRAISQMDFSEFKKQGHIKLSKKLLRDRIFNSVQTIATYVKDPQLALDLDKHMKENTDIMTGVLAFIAKDPEIRLNFENYLKEHQDVFSNFSSSWGKVSDNRERDITFILREKNQVAITAPIIPKGTKTVDKGVATTCYLDDRFISWDQIEPVQEVAIEPQPAIPSLPFNCR